MEIFVEARRNLSTKNDQDDDKSQPLRHVHGRATVGGGETTTVVISQGNKADDRTIGENGGVSHHSPRRIPRTAMIPVAVLSASAVLVLAFVCVSSLRGEFGAFLEALDGVLRVPDCDGGNGSD